MFILQCVVGLSFNIVRHVHTRQRTLKYKLQRVEVQVQLPKCAQRLTLAENLKIAAGVMFSAVARRLSGGAKEMAADLVRAKLAHFELLVLLAPQHLTCFHTLLLLLPKGPACN
jgi:hypothetical protein